MCGVEHKSKDSVNLTWVFENHLYSSLNGQTGTLHRKG